MAMRVCLVPVVGVGTHEDPRRGKYFLTGDVPEMLHGTDYGFEPWMIGSADLSDQSLGWLQAQPDAWVLPQNLDALLLAGHVTTVEGILEAMHLPAEWVSTAYTWRQVARIVVGVFRFMARFAVVYVQAGGGVTPIFVGGVDLSRTYSSLALPVRDALIDTAVSLSLDTSGITGASTLRAILKSVGTQSAAQALTIGSVKV